MSKSAEIRRLYRESSMTVKQIANKVGVRYQFAYNVIRQMADKTGEEVRKSPIKFGTPEAAERARAVRREKEEIAARSPILDAVVTKGAAAPTREAQTPMKAVKSSEVLALLELGFEPEEVSDALGVNLSFVQNVAKVLKRRNAGGS